MSSLPLFETRSTSRTREFLSAPAHMCRETAVQASRSNASLHRVRENQSWQSCCPFALGMPRESVVLPGRHLTRTEDAAPLCSSYHISWPLLVPSSVCLFSLFSPSSLPLLSPSSVSLSLFAPESRTQPGSESKCIFQIYFLKDTRTLAISLSLKWHCSSAVVQFILCENLRACLGDWNLTLM